jgi:hypothetical protein
MNSSDESYFQGLAGYVYQRHVQLLVWVFHGVTLIRGLPGSSTLASRAEISC